MLFIKNIVNMYMEEVLRTAGNTTDAGYLK